MRHIRSDRERRAMFGRMAQGSGSKSNVTPTPVKDFFHQRTIKKLRAREEKLETMREKELKKLEDVKDRLSEQRAVAESKQDVRVAKDRQRQAITDEIDKEKARIRELREENEKAKKEIFAKSPTGRAVIISKSAISKTNAFFKKDSTKAVLKSIGKVIAGKPQAVKRVAPKRKVRRRTRDTGFIF